MTTKREVLTLPGEKHLSKPQRVFVYGTLKRGFNNHPPYLGTAKYLGEGLIEGIMFHLSAYPAINLDEKFTKIHGEVYECTWDDIQAMDRLEGVASGSFYRRVEVKIFPYDNVWTYVFDHERASRERFIIPSGIWRGRDTPKCLWEGWGKGAAVGAFFTGSDEITVCNSYELQKASEFILKRNNNAQTYSLVRRATGEVLGTYRNLGDRMTSDGKWRPAVTIDAQKKIETVVKDTVMRQAAGGPLQGDTSILALPSPTGTETGAHSAAQKQAVPELKTALGYAIREA